MFIPWLDQRLKKTLPGVEAHSTIWSYPRNSVTEGLQMDPPPRQSAVALLIYATDEHCFDLLFIVRSDFGIHGGQVAFPGGKIEVHENAIQCAIRETSEEIGVNIDESIYIGNLSSVFIPPSHMIVHPHVFVLKNKIEKFTITHEVAQVFWVQQGNITQDKIITKPHYLKAFNETRPIKGIALNEHFLWGASAMITSELMHLHQEYLNLMNQNL